MDYGLRRSQNYMWSVQSKSGKLGVGATGSVFKCRKIEDGSLFAAKILNQRSNHRPNEVIVREIEILKNLKHPNIVKLVAVEHDSERNLVIITELCGKSLLNILTQPENVYGLPEDDYKAVIHDITQGMKYLKNQSVVHRDVKPGNILQSCDLKTGRFIYKICDFGGARVLQDDGEFESIYGTEEYLHPDIYKKAVMHYLPKGTFNNTVDLWSLGVTYYHLACGRLPFVPYLHRSDKSTMYTMLIKKPAGSISCHQIGKNGELEYHNELPLDSRISKGLRTLITPVLQGLMETDPMKMISHEQFFHSIDQIVSMKVIHVYVSQTSHIHKIYMSRQNKLSHLQDHIALVTGIKETEQELYYYGKSFQPECSDCIDSYPDFTIDDPLILISSHFVFSQNFEQKKIPSLNYSGGGGKAHKSDSDFSEIYANYAYTLYFEAENIEVECHAIHKAQSLFRSVTKRCLELSQLQCHHLKNQVEKDFQIFQNYDRVLSKFTSEPQSQVKTIDEQYSNIQTLLKDCLNLVEDLFKGNISDDIWNIETKNITGTVRAKDLDGCVKVINEIDTMFKEMKGRKLTNFNELEIKSERTRLVDTYAIIHKNVQVKYQKHRNILHDAFTTWLKNVFEKRAEVSQKLDTLMDEFTKFSEEFSRISQKYPERLESCINSSLMPINQEEIRNIVQENTKTLAYFDSITGFTKE